ncbi:hypothetical protein [Streptomyces neyagawaensis]|uniref:hypothetical protein n=1 Tax=Streptomyces neyagawaensis TaxID=42238 RepID=UPI0006E3FBAD|nr:hypothetical protein [Streptomyces neyagawaensis]MCL6738015.1 hypothetical protein [Streptomyces neyagawaensis]MDE1688320.1 hypothetical protein [Streptomyces neyagawaensis]
MRANEVTNLTAVEPGAYVAVYETGDDDNTQELYPVVAIATYMDQYGRMGVAPVISKANHMQVCGVNLSLHPMNDPDIKRYAGMLPAFTFSAPEDAGWLYRPGK